MQNDLFSLYFVSINIHHHFLLWIGIFFTFCYNITSGLKERRCSHQEIILKGIMQCGSVMDHDRSPDLQHLIQSGRLIQRHIDTAVGTDPRRLVQVSAKRGLPCSVMESDP